MSYFVIYIQVCTQNVKNYLYFSIVVQYTTYIFIIITSSNGRATIWQLFMPPLISTRIFCRQQHGGQQTQIKIQITYSIDIQTYNNNKILHLCDMLACNVAITQYYILQRMPYRAQGASESLFPFSLTEKMIDDFRKNRDVIRYTNRLSSLVLLPFCYVVPYILGLIHLPLSN